jgi:hypothetical protein
MGGKTAGPIFGRLAASSALTEVERKMEAIPARQTQAATLTMVLSGAPRIATGAPVHFETELLIDYFINF